MELENYVDHDSSRPYTYINLYLRRKLWHIRSQILVLLAAHVLASAQFPLSAKAIQSTLSMQTLASDVEHALLSALRKLSLRTNENLIRFVCRNPADFFISLC